MLTSKSGISSGANVLPRLRPPVWLTRAWYGTALTIPFRDPKADHVFHQYVIRARRRDELREFLTARKIGSEVYYPLPLHLQPCFGYLGYRKGEFPESEKAAAEVLALPMFPELTEDEQRWVVQSIADFFKLPLRKATSQP